MTAMFFIHINNDYQENWPSFKRILGFEFGIKDRCYERIVENNFTDPYTSKQKVQCKK